MTRFWDRPTDGVTKLLDLLSPLATQVKTHSLNLDQKQNKKNLLGPFDIQNEMIISKT